VRDTPAAHAQERGGRRRLGLKDRIKRNRKNNELHIKCAGEMKRENAVMGVFDAEKCCG
jgi:hypothetical protein